jgi:hypothetical protein
MSLTLSVLLRRTILAFAFAALSASAQVPANYEGLWWANPAGAESGWGINFAHQADTIFASWFTYDTSGQGMWLVMTAPKTANVTYSGTLYETRGPAFNSVPFNPSSVSATAVGSATLTFSDVNTGTFDYVVNGIHQTKTITREVFDTMPTCGFAALADITKATNYQDLWWAAPAASESGWGINLTHQGNTIFATWFTYDLGGSPLWLVVTANQTAPGAFSGTLYRTTGPAFNAVPFNPSLVNATAVGTATFTFANGNSGTFNYSITGVGPSTVTQTKSITREIFAVPGTACIAPGGGPPAIKSFSVSADQPLTWPNSLANIPDEHTTIVPPAAPSGPYLVFAASKITGGTGGAVVLQTTDLATFTFADGYNHQVFAPPVDIAQCNSTYATEFDENYAAPGTVVQDPTLPAGNLMMFYEAENHCPGGVNQQPYYATVGFARSSDNGKTWPTPENSVLGAADRHPVLKAVNPQPATGGYTPMGNAIPSAFVDRNSVGDQYVYVVYGYNSGGFNPAADGIMRVGRAKLGTDPLAFLKWYNGSFGQPGIGGLDTGVLPSTGCSPNARQAMAEINYNDDLQLYLLIFVCQSGTTGSRVAAWYYSSATSLDLQNWSAPQLIANSQFPITTPCSTAGTGSQFDGWYPSFMSPGAAAGHTRLTGKVFFQNGCDTASRVFASRTFTITTGP